MKTRSPAPASTAQQAPQASSSNAEHTARRGVRPHLNTYICCGDDIPAAAIGQLQVGQAIAYFEAATIRTGNAALVGNFVTTYTGKLRVVRAKAQSSFTTTILRGSGKSFEHIEKALQPELAARLAEALRDTPKSSGCAVFDCSSKQAPLAADARVTLQSRSGHPITHRKRGKSPVRPEDGHKKRSRSV